MGSLNQEVGGMAEFDDYRDYFITGDMKDVLAIKEV